MCYNIRGTRLLIRDSKSPTATGERCYRDSAGGRRCGAPDGGADGGDDEGASTTTQTRQRSTVTVISTLTSVSVSVDPGDDVSGFCEFLTVNCGYT